MLVENRIKGVFIWTLSIIYLVLFILIFVNNPESISWLTSFIFLSFTLVLGLSGLYVFKLKKLLNFRLNITVIFLGVLLSTIIIYLTNGVNGNYFPLLYLIILIYGALSRGKLLLFITTTLSILLIATWLILTTSQINYVIKSDYALYVLILLVLIYVIRNYPLECITCTSIDNKTCNHRDSCSISQSERIN